MPSRRVPSTPSRRRAPGTRRASRRAPARGAAAGGDGSTLDARLRGTGRAPRRRGRPGSPGSAPPRVRHVDRVHLVLVVEDRVHHVDRELELVDAAARAGGIELRVVGLRLLARSGASSRSTSRGCPRRASSAWRGSSASTSSVK